MLVIPRRVVRVVQWCSFILVGLVASIGLAEAQTDDGKYDTERATAIESIFKSMPEFRAVERVLAGVMPSFMKLGAATNLRYDIDNFSAKLSVNLAKTEFKEQRVLNIDVISRDLREKAESLMLEVGCFVAFAEHPSLATQWQALAPVLKVDDYTTWLPVAKAVRERCKVGLDSAKGKPEGGSAAT